MWCGGERIEVVVAIVVVMVVEEKVVWCNMVCDRGACRFMWCGDDGDDSGGVNPVVLFFFR